MQRKWLITEKIIAVILIIWGCIFFYNISYSAYTTVHVFTNQPNKGYSLSIAYLFKIYHFFFLLSLLTLFGGAGFLFGKKWGWASALIACGVTCAGTIAVTLLMGKKEEETYFVGSLFAFVFAIAFVLLMLKPFRQKYSPSKTLWVVIFIITTTLAADITITRLSEKLSDLQFIEHFRETHKK